MDYHYKELIVAFIDILGFSDLVKRSSTDSESLKKISKIVDFVRDAVLEQEKIFKPDDDPFYLHISFISDSIVISTDAPSSANDPQFWHILKFVGSIGLNLLAIGVSCRGSIVIGQIFHHRESNFDAVVGPALVKAYEIERSVAVYPRIVVDSSVINFWKEYLADQLNPDSWREVLKLDQDGKWFINIFHPIFVSVVKHLFCYRGYREDYDIIKEIGDLINKGLEESKQQPKVRDKYTWLLSQYRPYVSTDFRNALEQTEIGASLTQKVQSRQND